MHGNPFAWRFATPMFLGSALNPINSSLIATGLVPIAHGVHTAVGRTAVLVSALYLASAIAQPTAGRLSEVLGARRVFLSGLVLVLAGGLLGGLGRTLGVLLVARVLIGVGTSAGYPSAMVMIRRRAEAAGLPEPPGGMLGGLQIAGTATAALGLPIGGVLINAFGWRAVFLTNVPVALLAFVLAVRWLPRDAPVDGSVTVRDVVVRVDLAGVAAFAATISALLVFLDALPHARWPVLGVAIACGAALVAWELRARPAFLDVRMLAGHRALTRTYVRYALTSVSIYTMFYGLSQWLESVRALSARDAGLLLLPMTALSAVILLPISRRNLVRGPLIAAAGSSIAGALGLLLLDGRTPTLVIVLVTLIFGVTLGTFASANQSMLYLQADAAEIGTAAGLLRTFGYVGSIASAAFIGIVFRHGVTDGGLHVIGLALAGVGLAGLALALTGEGRLGGQARTGAMSSSATQRATPSG